MLIGCQQTKNVRNVEADLNELSNCYEYMPTERVFYKDNRIFLEDFQCLASFELPVKCDKMKPLQNMCSGAGNTFWIDGLDFVLNVTINKNEEDPLSSNFVVSNLEGDSLWSCPVVIDGAEIILPGFAFDENHISFSVDGGNKRQIVVNSECKEDTLHQAISLHKTSKFGDSYLKLFGIDGKAFVVYKDSLKEVLIDNMNDKDPLTQGFYFENPYLLLLTTKNEQLYVEKYKLEDDMFVFVGSSSLDIPCVKNECGWIFPCDDGACIRIDRPGRKFIKLKS